MGRMPKPHSIVETPIDRSRTAPPFRPYHHPPATSGGQAKEAALMSVTQSAAAGYPIQPAKVQRPALRDETLARDRLLDWLAAKAHSRVVLVLADAGYGKTTLLADFSRRTRLRTLWYRLDEDDRDWIAFLNHLVAAGREHDSAFAPTTAAMLSELSTGGPTREATTDVFLRELPSITGQGAILILDDFHLVDESPDVRAIVRELIVRGPERLTVVFASRRPPSVPIARLRAAGEVAALGTDDLRFDASETARLFRESYGRDLEPDVLSDVTARTEGWAASLQLVHAALRDRSPAEIRRFVRSLNGADQELYDYLAEEVVGDLPEDLQHFLMCTSLLQDVTPELAAVAAGIDSADVARLSTAAERMTLLSRASRGSRGQRFHPLVREFLEARLRASTSEASIAQIHLRIAAVAADRDWRTAAYHYREAGEFASVATTIASALPEIMGTGQHAAAAEEIGQLPPDVRIPSLALVDSRVRMQQRQVTDAVALSKRVLASVKPGSPEGDFALLNLASAYYQAGMTADALPLALRLASTTTDDQLRAIAHGTSLMIEATGTGDLDALAAHLQDMARFQRERYPHFFGVTMLNLAIVAVAQDEPRTALRFASDAVEALESTSSRIELAAAQMAKATALALLGEGDEARAAIERAAAIDAFEASLEQVELLDGFIDPAAAGSYVSNLERASRIDDASKTMAAQQLAMYHARRRQVKAADRALLGLTHQRQSLSIASATISAFTDAYVAAVNASDDAPALAHQAREAALTQKASRWQHMSELLIAYLGSDADFNRVVEAAGTATPWNLTYVADLVVRRIDDLSASANDTVLTVALRYRGRWQFVLRDHLDANPDASPRMATLLDRIGEIEDVVRLRKFARRHRRLSGATFLGRGLARRLADRVYVDDLGPVSIAVGSRGVLGSMTRRKVLALLCFLLTKPAMSSTRDQVLDALWPDLDPVDALNSLNQTVYFLRRVFEEHYVDDLSPGYLRHESDLIWLDPDLVASQSNECRALIKALPISPSPDQVTALVERYRGRFALDFEYEEWASPYRDWLHAAYLEIVERAVLADLESGHFDRGIAIARRALDVDPSAESVEVSLLRLYRASGAHAAAAEQ